MWVKRLYPSVIALATKRSKTLSFSSSGPISSTHQSHPFIDYRVFYCMHASIYEKGSFLSIFSWKRQHVDSHMKG